jgi:putative transposase
MGTFGATTIRVPRARLVTSEGKTTEWRNATIPAYQRRTRRADALIAGAYLSGTNTRCVRRALAALFGGAVGKDTVSRVWRKTKGDWDAWNARSLIDEPIMRIILDGTVVRVRLDKKATLISLLVALGVRSDGQKVLLVGGESEAAWRALLDNLVARGLKTPELVIVDGGSGLDKALAALWPDAPVQRCTVHKHRNLLAHAFFQAVGHGATFEPPFADEGLPLRLDLLLHLGVNHVVVVGRDFLVQPVWTREIETMQEASERRNAA